jgi:hypothetical protein
MPPLTITRGGTTAAVCSRCRQPRNLRIRRDGCDQAVPNRVRAGREHDRCGRRRSLGVRRYGGINNDHGSLPVDQISQESRFAVLCECLLPNVFLLLGLEPPRDWDGSNHPGPLDGPITVLDWIIAAREDNRDCRSCRLGSRAGVEPPVATIRAGCLPL